jgi:hypothetical protein
MRQLVFLVFALSSSSCSCGEPSPDGAPRPDSGATAGDAGPVLDGSPLDGSPVDAARSPDGSPSLADAAAHDGALRSDGSALAPPSCGATHLDVSGIALTDGIAISRAGTLYYSQRDGVGRLVPGGDPEDEWLTDIQLIGAGSIALDAANEHLYVAVPLRDAVYRVELGATPPRLTEFLSDVRSVNRLRIGPDDALYFTTFSAIGGVLRAPLGGESSTATEIATLDGASGLLFLPDGTLLVSSTTNRMILQLTLGPDHIEVEREVYAAFFADSQTPDGMALDDEGRVYVVDDGGSLMRIQAGGIVSTTLLEIDRETPHAIEFGAGALDCRDLYITSTGPMLRYEAERGGAPVPWH